MKRNQKSQKGVSFVETTIVLPVFIILMMGIVEFSRLLNAHITAAHLAYEGARLASKTPGLIQPNGIETYSVTENLIREKIMALSSKNGINILAPGNISFQATLPQNNLNASNISVTVNLPYTPSFGLFSPGEVSSDSTTEYTFAKN